MDLKNLILEKLNEPVGDFCKNAKISRQTYQNIMNGGNGYISKSGRKYKPDLFTIKKICSYFGVDPRSYI